MSAKAASKADAVPLIQDWLQRTYKVEEGETVSKREVYSDYLEFCDNSNIPSTNPSTFGKILKLVFPDLTSRRIGPRGDSFPHYNSFSRVVKRPDSNQTVPQRRVIKGKRKSRKNTNDGSAGPDKDGEKKHKRKRRKADDYSSSNEVSEEDDEDNEEEEEEDTDSNNSTSDEKATEGRILERLKVGGKRKRNDRQRRPLRKVSDENEESDEPEGKLMEEPEDSEVVEVSVIGSPTLGHNFHNNNTHHNNHNNPQLRNSNGMLHVVIPHGYFSGFESGGNSPVDDASAALVPFPMSDSNIINNNNNNTFTTNFAGVSKGLQLNNHVHSDHAFFNANNLALNRNPLIMGTSNNNNTSNNTALCNSGEHHIHNILSSLPTISTAHAAPPAQRLFDGNNNPADFLENLQQHQPHPELQLSDLVAPNSEAASGADVDDDGQVLKKVLSDSLMWDSHLQFVAIVDTYRTIYYRYIYATNPTNPAAFDMQNIQYLVCTNEGAAERSVLSLNVYFLLSAGSLYSGDFVRAREFYNLTREHLGYVFDSTDYSLALVLIPLSFLARYWADTEEEGARTANYYLTLGKTICENLGYTQNPIYVRFTQSLAWYTRLEEDKDADRLRPEGLPYFPTLASDSMRMVHTDLEDSLLEEPSLQHHCTFFSCIGVIGSVLKGIMAYRVHRVMRDRWERFVDITDDDSQQQLLLSLDEHVGIVDTTREEKEEREKGKEKEEEEERERKIGREGESHFMEIDLDESSETAEGGLVIEMESARKETTDIDLALERALEQEREKAERREKEKEKEREKETEKEKGIDYGIINSEEEGNNNNNSQIRQRPAKEGEVVFGNGFTLMKLMDALGNTEKALRARMVSDKPLPKHILLFIKQFLWAEEAMIFYHLGETSLALKVIKYFILSLRGFRNVLHCATILEVPMGMVMEVLARSNEMDLFNDILKLLEPVTMHSPSINRMVNRFLRMDADNFW